MTDDAHSRRGTVSTLRRVIVGIIVVSFSLAAIGGIIVLLGGELNDTGFKVLSTTGVVGSFSVAVLCCAALAGRRLQPFGLIGAAVSVVTAGFTVALVWAEWSWGDGFWRALWTGVCLTAAFSLASLLLLLADRTQRAVRVGLVVTIGLFCVVLALTLVVIWWPDAVDDQVFPRVLGIASILAALGAVVVPVISLLLRGRQVTPDGLSAVSRERLATEAARRGISQDELVAALLAAPSSEAPRTP